MDRSELMKILTIQILSNMEQSDKFKQAFQEALDERISRTIEEQNKHLPGVIRGLPDEASRNQVIRGLPADYSEENDVKTTILGLKQ